MNAVACRAQFVEGIDQNPYKSPQVVAEEKPADTMPPLPQWRMRLGMACYVVEALMVIYGVSAFYPPWELPHGRDLFPISGHAIAWAGRLRQDTNQNGCGPEYTIRLAASEPPAGAACGFEFG